MPRVLLWFLGLCACTELDLPSARPRRESNVQIEPLGGAEGAPAVVRLRVVGALGSSNLADFRVFSGELSSYHLGRIRVRELPSTLLERELGVLAWVEERDVLVAPTAALASGEYSLATPELGLVARLLVDETLVPWLERIWPPPGELWANGVRVFCGAAASAIEPGVVTLAPSGATAELRRGIGANEAFSERCASLLPLGQGMPGVPELPPLLAGGVAFEPLPLVTEGVPVEPPVCAPGDLLLGSTCALTDDDRVVLRSDAESSFWALEEPEPVLGVVSAGESLVVHGLVSGQPTRVRGSVFDRNGSETVVDTWLVGAAPRPHVVINEVLANPVGPEATGEWVELVNDGSEPVELQGLELRDAGGALELPHAELGPGEFILLAREGFAPDTELDVAPARGTRVLVLPSLVASGLGNSGELLRLSDASGRVLSRFPGLAAKEAGTSLARRTPDAPDDDTSAFAPHAAPGASPGSPNELD